MIHMRSFTEAGRRTALHMLDRIKAGELDGPDMAVLDQPANSRPLDVLLPPPPTGETATRWDVGFWLLHGLAGSEQLVDDGAWSWLALNQFDLLCPIVGVRRKVREHARYVLEAGDYRKAHRHLLKGPWLLLQAHHSEPDAVRGLLATAPDAPGEVYEQLATRKFLVTSRAVVKAATKLYFDPSTMRLKRGAGGAAAGSPRRLSEVLQQLDLTFDLQAIPEERLLALLPREFNRFRR